MKIYLVHAYSEDYENTYDAFSTEEEARLFIKTITETDFIDQRIVAFGEDSYGVYGSGWEEGLEDEYIISNGSWKWIIRLEEVDIKEYHED